MALICAGVAFIGFVPTYWVPLVAGSLHPHPVIHVHALVFFSWVLFLVAQTWLASTRRIAWHRAMGMFGISIATAMTILGILTAIDRMQAATAIGQKAAGLAFAIVPIGAIAFFAIAFAAAIANVRRPDWHKRLMLVASVSILDAPIARWFMLALAPPGAAGPPPVSVDLGPSLVASVLLVVAMAVDWLRRKQVHPAYLIGACTYIGWKLAQEALSTTSQWQVVAEWIMRLGG
jgi:hypothetical protein